MISTLADLSPSTFAAAAAPKVPAKGDDKKVRETFDRFVGQTFYGQMIGSMRQTVGKPAYFHGGRAEEIFGAQLDQVMAEEMTENTASQFTGPMYELFTLQRS